MGACCSTDRYEGSQAYLDSGDRDVGAGAHITKMNKKERKRQLMEALAAEAKTNELLARIPGRMCRNGASNAICIFTQQGRKGTNQDAMVAWEDYIARKDTIFCGVFDGHGPYGHLVARRVRDSLPSKLASIWKARMRGESTAGDDTKYKDGWVDNTQQAILDMVSCVEVEGRNDDNPAASNSQSIEQEKQSEGEGEDEEEKEGGGGEMWMMYNKWKEAFVEAFEAMDLDLRRHPSIDGFCSGTTAVTLLKQGEDLIIGNVGDSRAVLATKCRQDDTLQAIQLTVDLKPSLPREAERILKCRGRVFALADEPEVQRVWLPYDDAPGLAMARAFGDFCLKDFGLISVPDVTHRKLSSDDQFVVLATDGVWDVLSNKEVVDIVSGAPTRATAARALVETAVRAWRLKYPNSKVDDCAVVCLYLHPPSGKGGKEAAVTQYRKAGEDDASQCKAVPHEGDARSEAGHGGAEEGMMQEASFGRSNTVRVANNGASLSNTNDEVGSEGRRPGLDSSHSVRSIADCLSAADEDEWSALEGVVRVNSLLNLPRFRKGDKRAPDKTSSTKGT